MKVDVTSFTDPGCPWAYSSSPALAVTRFRFGDQLDWRHVMIGLAEERSQYEERGYTALKMAHAMRGFRRFGMPFGNTAKAAVAATSRACRAIVAVRLQNPERELAALRALQFLQFTTPHVLDDDAAVLAALRTVDGIDAEAALEAIENDEVVAAYEEDRALTRSAAGTPAEVQDKTATTDGPVRYTAPSLIFTRGETTLIAGGYQHQHVYDVLLANLAPELERREAPDDVVEVLESFPDGLTTAEVAEIYASGPARETDRDETEDRLLTAVGEARATRVSLGDDARWLPGASSYPEAGWLLSDTSRLAASR